MKEVRETAPKPAPPENLLGLATRSRPAYDGRVKDDVVSVLDPHIRTFYRTRTGCRGVSLNVLESACVRFVGQSEGLYQVGGEWVASSLQMRGEEKTRILCLRVSFECRSLGLTSGTIMLRERVKGSSFHNKSKAI